MREPQEGFRVNMNSSTNEGEDNDSVNDGTAMRQ